MSTMNIRAIICLVVYGIFCFCISLAFVQCSEKQAQEQIRSATIEAETFKKELSHVNSENAKLREIVSMANVAIERAMQMILEAKEKHEQRIETITSDPDSVDWLACELPDSVRDAFKDYCSDTDGDNPTP